MYLDMLSIMTLGIGLTVAAIAIFIIKPIFGLVFWSTLSIVMLIMIPLGIRLMDQGSLFDWAPVIGGLIICASAPGIGLILGTLFSPRRRP